MGWKIIAFVEVEVRAWTRGRAGRADWTRLGRLGVHRRRQPRADMSLCHGHMRVWPDGQCPRWETGTPLLTPGRVRINGVTELSLVHRTTFDARGLRSIGPSQIRRGPENHQALSARWNAFSHRLPCHTHSSLVCTTPLGWALPCGCEICASAMVFRCLARVLHRRNSAAAARSGYVARRRVPRT